MKQYYRKDAETPSEQINAAISCYDFFFSASPRLCGSNL
jgi:hypothetical protein